MQSHPTPTSAVVDPREPGAVGAEIATRVRVARRRLEARAGLDIEEVAHYRLAPERAFTAAERGSVTVLFGGLTARHERLIQAILESCGHRCEPLPQPDLAACLLGKAYCNNGVCNPAYFTIGNLLKYLRGLEASGLSRQDIIDRYVFFTAGSCGPCRFGMYEAEYRLALRNAGFEGFRVLLFQQQDGVRAQTGEPGLKFTLRLGLGAVNAFIFADALNLVGYAVRPFESAPGTTDRKLDEALEVVADALRNRPDLQPANQLPPWLWRWLENRRGLSRTAALLLALQDHLYGPATAAALAACADVLDEVEVDRLRVKPVVKVTGEFWASTAEGDGNFRMFSFLEHEGAHVMVEPLSGWVLYLLNQARATLLDGRGVAVPRVGPWVERLLARGRDEKRVAMRRLWMSVGERIYRHHYNRVRRIMGGLAHPLIDQRLIARLASPYYHHLARGGEGHLEVGKSIYYTTRHGAHLVLSLKPFGCMPSTQSDGVQSSVTARFKDMVFLPVETAADGELTAHSRVQMALVEARSRAQAEFDRALAATGKRLEDVEDFVAAHANLWRLGYAVPDRSGVAGVAANFVLHVSNLMDRDRRARRAIRVPPPMGQVT